MKQSYPTPPDETQRLKALEEYCILDTIPEEEYDSITSIAARICNTSFSLITLLDKDRQWFKSYTGLEITGISREHSFCNYTIMTPGQVTIIPDLRTDHRFVLNPLVTGSPQAVFYAGAPLVTPEGFVLGSLCVLDQKTQSLDKYQCDTLMSLAKQVVTQLELRKKSRELGDTQKKLGNARKVLTDLSNVVSHDMKTPLANILLVNRMFRRKYGPSLEGGAAEYMNLIEESAHELLEFIDEVLVHPQNTEQFSSNAN